MGEAVGPALPFAVGLALSPFPLVAMTLILGAARRADAVVFALASVAGVAGVGAVVLLVAGDDAADAEGDPAAWVSVLRLALGLLLLAYGAKGVAGARGGGVDRADAGPPRWLRAMEGLTPARAAGLGLLASALNPKNLALTVAGAAAIAEAELDAGAAAASLAVLVVVGTLGVTVPLGVALALGPRSEPVLAAVRDRAERHSAAITAVLALVIGAVLVGEAVGGFAAA